MTADPIINLGHYQAGMEKLWVAFQLATNPALRNRVSTKRHKDALITVFNENYLPLYHGIVLAVTENDDPIGYGAFVKEGREAGYTSAYVDPLHRRKGIFGKITDEIISLAKESGARKLDAVVTSEQLPIDSLLRREFQEAPRDSIRTVEGTPLRRML